MKPLVSIIVPFFNAAKTINRCLVSIFTQRYEPIEYIFVDDGSTDGSSECVNMLLNDYPHHREHCHFISHDVNMGSYAARCAGLRKITGDYVIQVDADDYVEQGYIEALVEKGLQTDADLVLCDYTVIDGQETRQQHLPQLASSEDLLCKMLTGEVHSALWNKLFKRTVVETIGLNANVVKNMYDDKVLCTEALMVTKKIAQVSLNLYVYHRQLFNSTTYSTRYAIKPEMDFICFCERYFAANDASTLVLKSFDVFKLRVRGKSLLYGSKEELAMTAEFGGSIGKILKLQNIPFYYKGALLLDFFHLRVIIYLFRLFIKKV